MVEQFAMSVLDRFFEAHDVVKDLIAVRRAVLGGEGDDQSYGCVKSIGLFHRWSGSGRRPEREGIFCQRIFGPIVDWRCACGSVEGRAHGGETCARCGVLCANSEVRNLRYGHIEVSGVVHPQMAPVIARVLGIGIDDVLALARCEARFVAGGVEALTEMDDDVVENTGPEALVARLKAAGAGVDVCEAAVTRLIPVPPPGRRPFTGGLGPVMIDPWIGPVNEVWRSLVLRSNRQRRLAELAAPAILDLNEQRSVQRLFERVLASTGEPPNPDRLWPAPKVPEHPTRLMAAPEVIPADADEHVVGLIFVDEERLFIQRPQRSWLVDARSGEVLREYATSGRMASSVHGVRLRMDRWMSHEWEWYAGDDAYWAAESGRSEIAVLDFETGEYLDTYPADLPRRRIGNDQPEDLLAGDMEAPSVTNPEDALGESQEGLEMPLRWGGDRPSVLACTRDARYAWVGEDEDTAVVDADRGFPVADPVMVARIEERDVVLRLADAEDVRDESDGFISAPALGITGEQRLRFLHESGHVSDGETSWFRIDAVPSAAGFSPMADRLAIAVEDEIVIVGVAEGGSILYRFQAPTLARENGRGDSD